MRILKKHTLCMQKYILLMALIALRLNIIHAIDIDQQSIIIPCHQHSVFCNIQTTGLDIKNDRIVSIGIVHQDDEAETTECFHSYINPDGRQSSADAKVKHRIPDETLSWSPRFADIAPRILTELNRGNIFAHYSSFVRDMLYAEFNRAGYAPDFYTASFLCTYILSCRQYENRKGNNTLDALCERYEVTISDEMPLALAKAYALKKCYEEMKIDIKIP